MHNFLKILIILMILVLEISNLKAQDIKYSQSGDDLQTLAERFLPSVKKKYGNQIEDYKKDLQKWNPHIKDWSNLPSKTPFYSDYPYIYFLSYEYAEDLTSKLPPAELPFKNSLFYTASVGTFSETTAQNKSIDSTQNSPVSIGFASAYKMSDDQYILGSFYWSKLIASEVEGSVSNANSKISVPNELGFNFYYQHAITKLQISAYGGIDQERFATYNTADLELGQSLEMRTNDVSYITLGVAKNFHLKNLTLNTKASWAKSIISKNSTSLPSNDFSGNRTLLFLSLSNKTPFTYHFLFKRHSFEGPTKLTINRAGVGAGYSF